MRWKLCRRLWSLWIDSPACLSLVGIGGGEVLRVYVLSLEDLKVSSDSLLGVGGGASTIGVGISEPRRGSALSIEPTLRGGVVGVLDGRTGKSRILALGVSVVGVYKSSYASSTEGNRGSDFENDSARS